MNIHFIGIGGIGISGLAQLCATRGDTVSGSNKGQNPVFDILKKAGITNIYDQHDPKNIPQNTDLIVYTEAIPTDNVELQYAQKEKIPTKTYFQYLGEISEEYRTIAIAGTHGKTTTTGLIACGFMAADFDSTILVGSTLDAFGGRNFKIINPVAFNKDSRPWLLVEACEYRENFKYLKPKILVLTNIEFDHADYFQDEAHYFKAFEDLANRSKMVCYHEQDEAVQAMVQKTTAKPIPIPEQSANSVAFYLNIFGEANRQNATLALGLAHLLPLRMEVFKLGLGKFKGAGRRQEFLGTVKNKKGAKINIFDDYGHHPTEISATIEAFHERFPHTQITLIFEPHQYSRTRIFFDDFVLSLKKADNLGLYPIYEARDSTEDLAAVDITDLAKALPNSHLITDIKSVTTLLDKVEDDHICLFMGAGDISDFARDFVREMK